MIMLYSKINENALFWIKVCAHYGKVVHPNNRDDESTMDEVQVVADYLKRFFKGVGEKPSIIEKCYYTVCFVSLLAFEQDATFTNNSYFW